MLEKFKSTSLITKLLYLFAFILLVAWVIPKVSAYYSTVNTYKDNTEALRSLSAKHGISTSPKTFTKILFKQDSTLLFSKVTINDLEEKEYAVDISMKREDLNSFHTFLDTLALKYYVEVSSALKFTTEDETINVKMNLKAL
ncbi:MAG: Unknown protein [uncultured Sulfurovum sp.]|uniref:Uncharacterized protein n=1 Tax=uncultured Sulfurovum sp. TaxID=269237 RepID=A0A6S6SVV2_9BACT|nr:MAG: Unknown protein [uncultured Sulfurovum sp.]